MAAPGNTKTADVDWIEEQTAVRVCRVMGTLEPAEGEPLETCTITTTEPNELMAPIHNRMPVILVPTAYDQWLDPTFQHAESLKGLLRPYPSDELLACPVNTGE
jgi:putative SOS response-associated peptidase YedK